MSRTLYVAAGGGGDVLAAWALHRSASTSRPVIATYSWDRLIIDPLPGPRTAADFEGLRPLDDQNWLVQPSTRPKPPAGSTLPRLAGELDADLALLDPAAGAAGISTQLRSLIDTLEADQVDLVDVGGDVLAHGDEPELLSPMADSLALAGTSDLQVPVRVRVLGLGLDGELMESDLRQRLNELGGVADGLIDRAAAQTLLPVLDWYPSEAAALLIAAAIGLRGTAEIRDQRRPVQLTSDSSSVYTVDRGCALDTNRIAAALIGSSDLDEVEKRVRAIRGRTEVDYERVKSTTNQRHRLGSSHNETASAEAVRAQLTASGVDFISYRRLAERLQISIERASMIASQMTPDSRPLLRCGDA